MKIVYASTPEQENHIEELVSYIYSDIFPFFFSDEYIMKLEELQVLEPTEEDVHMNGTLKEAFCVISSLQALIAVLETLKNGQTHRKYKEIFIKNVNLLKKHGYSFPFSMDHFLCPKNNYLSKFSKPTNQILV